MRRGFSRASARALLKTMRFQGFEFCFAKLKKLSQPASMPAKQPQVVY
jgi:hypothetical protein